MFDNNIDLQFNGSHFTLVRVNQDKFSSQYRHRSADWNIDMSIRHTSRTDATSGVTVDRHNVEVIYNNKVTSSTGAPKVIVTKAYFVYEAPSTKGPDDAVAFVNGLKDTLMTNDVIKRLANWES